MAVMNRQAIKVNLYPHTMHLVDISMCETMSEMRRVSAKKLARLAVAPFRLLLKGWQTGTKTLYFVPSSPSVNGLLKDAWILLISRAWFKRRIYHCHSGGVGVLLHGIPGVTGQFLRWVIGAPLAVIRVSSSAPDDHIGFRSTADFVVPNCILEESDLLGIERNKEKNSIQPLNLLFIGLHAESKGLFILLQAVAAVSLRGQQCMLTTLGSFNDDVFEASCRQFLKRNNLENRVDFAGPKFGADKVNALRNADVLVFPTHFECETFGLVVAESMAAGIPAIATAWSGLRDLIIDGQTGMLTPIKDPEAIAKAIEIFCSNRQLAQEMGIKARQRFIDQYSQAQFDKNFRRTIHEVLAVDAAK